MSSVVYKPYKEVKWGCLTYEQALDRGLVADCLKHTSELPEEKRIDYIKYLVRVCGYPRTLFDF